jgi:tetratricopeptide (TPR) repeat protein
VDRDDHIDPDAFLRRVTPLMESKDLPGLVATCRAHWTPEQIVSLLASDHPDARKVAACALSLVGTRCCLPPLARMLREPDPVVNSLAEHAMWSIWFRLGPAEANRQLARGAQALNDKNLEHAEAHFGKAIEIAPDFAEPYNQRAIVAYLTERFEDSVADARRAVELNPDHFGAWAGMGHCLAYLGRLPEAIDAYEHALAVNPHLSCVRELRDELLKQAQS